MAKRLEIAAAIALIGEDKLRDELDKNTWSFLHVKNELLDHEHQDLYDINIIKVPKMKRFTTEANPIEYLIFNEEAFVRDTIVDSILEEVCLHLGIANENSDSLLETVLDDDWKMTPEVCDVVWIIISKELTHEEIKSRFTRTRTHCQDVFFLFDKDGTQVFPDPSDEFLNKWFPK